MPTPILCPVPRQRWFDTNGNPLAGGKLYTYLSNSTTPKATYTDAGGVNLNTNPIILDSTGQADVWLDGDYKLVLTDSAGVQQWAVDGIDSSSGDDALETKFIAALVSMAGPISDRPTPNASLGQTNHGMLYFSLDEHKAYRWNGTAWIDVTANLFPPVPARTITLNFVIGDGSVVPSTGIKADIFIPFNAITPDWFLTGDASGSAVIDILTVDYEHFPGSYLSCTTDRPTLVAQQVNSKIGASWLCSIPGKSLTSLGTFMRISLTSVATCKQLFLTLVFKVPGA